MFPFVLFVAAVGAFYWYETVYKPSQVAPAPSGPSAPSNTSPTFNVAGITFLNPTLSQVALQALDLVPGTSSQQTDPLGRTYYVTTASTTLNDTPIGTSLRQAMQAGAIVLLVGPWASWASAGATGMPPTSPQIMTTGLPGAVDVKAAALSLLNVAGGGVALGPPPQGLA